MASCVVKPTGCVQEIARRSGEVAVRKIWKDEFPNFGNLANNIFVVKAALESTSVELAPESEPLDWYNQGLWMLVGSPDSSPPEAVGRGAYPPTSLMNTSREHKLSRYFFYYFSSGGGPPRGGVSIEPGTVALRGNSPAREAFPLVHPS
jgi:hypothetical protein